MQRYDSQEPMASDIEFSEQDQRSMMITEMERILNPSWFWRRLAKTDEYCTLSTSQYWDWITYIDDDYLSEWEVIKMKEMYIRQTQELSAQMVAHFGFAWLITFPLMGPIVKSAAHGWILRFPPAMALGCLLHQNGANWERSNKTFHELMVQPAPHGSYLRRNLKENFPMWWRRTSAQMHYNGYNLPEMYEYDRQTDIPKGVDFNSKRY